MNGRKAKRLRGAARACLRAHAALPLYYEPWAPPVFEFVSGRWFKVRRGVPCRLGKRCARRFYKLGKRLFDNA